MLGNFPVHLSQEPSQKKTFSHRRGVGLANGRAGAEHPGVLDVIVEVIEVAFLSRKI